VALLLVGPQPVQRGELVALRQEVESAGGPAKPGGVIVSAAR